MALQILRLPFTRERLVLEEMELRAVLIAAYRLLRALCADFPLMQMELCRHLPLFLSHCDAKLISRDMSPADCLSAIFKNNLAACSQVNEEVVRHIVRITGAERGPRFLRLLKTLLGPGDNPLPRVQALVMLCISQNRWIHRTSCIYSTSRIHAPSHIHPPHEARPPWSMPPHWSPPPYARHLCSPPTSAPLGLSTLLVYHPDMIRSCHATFSGDIA